MSLLHSLQVATVTCLLLVSSAAFATEKVPILIHAGGSTYKFNVEIADTADERAKGLMYREHLDSNEGMLFIYPVAQPVSFWMKNTPLPLDMLFIDVDGKIINVAAMAKPFDTNPISSKGSAIAVLEILGGAAVQLGIQSGDRVEWPVQDTAPTR